MNSLTSFLFSSFFQMDKYKVIESVGQGSFGQVFKGYDKDRPTTFLALKLMPKIDKREADILALRSECQIQFRVHHENVVRAIDSFETTEIHRDYIHHVSFN